MSQKFSLYEDLSITENFKFDGGIYGLSRNEIRERTKALLNRLNFLKAQNEVLRNIPQGWKQKLAFSVAVMHQPKVVFLDEPTGGVDPIIRR